LSPASCAVADAVSGVITGDARTWSLASCAAVAGVDAAASVVAGVAGAAAAVVSVVAWVVLAPWPCLRAGALSLDPITN
jgi:hypothetical protein